MKYTKYFIGMMILFVVCVMLGCILIYANSPAGSAVLFVMGFVFWFAGNMAPEDEKHSNRYRGR